MRRYLAIAVAIATLSVFGSLSHVLAFEPNRQTNEMVGTNGPETPILPGQEATARLKLAVAAGNMSAVPNLSAQAASVDAATSYTTYLVGTWERRQTLSYYCGPTAVQVEADYVWNMGASTVKYTQATISSRWTHTTTSGTSVASELVGANGVLVGSPRSAWPYWSYQPTSGADWSDKLKTDSVLTMPHIINLQPAWRNSSGTWYHLSSWGSNHSTGGHWIVGNGWAGDWDGTGGPNVRYDDGSGDFGGGTGTYWDDQYTMWQLIVHHNDYVIW